MTPGSHGPRTQASRAVRCSARQIPPAIRDGCAASATCRARSRTTGRPWEPTVGSTSAGDGSAMATAADSRGGTRKAGPAGGLWKPFSNLQITSLTAASDGKHIVISTLPVHDPVLGKPTPSQGKLFVFDTSGRQIVREIGPIADCVGTGFVIGVGRDRVLGLTTDPSNQKASVLYGVQTRYGEDGFRQENLRRAGPGDWREPARRVGLPPRPGQGACGPTSTA